MYSGIEEILTGMNYMEAAVKFEEEQNRSAAKS